MNKSKPLKRDEFVVVFFPVFPLFFLSVGTRNAKAQPLPTLLEQLKTTVNAKKYKDVDVLSLTEEVSLQFC